jgi:hypothetical protein
LYREFYAFCLSIADELQQGGHPASIALGKSLRAWRQLFSEAEGLSEDQELGLLGELWFLRELVRVHGPAIIHSWTGPRREAHDFRIRSSEFEVKSSRTDDHTHTISGLSQLVASVGCVLHVASIAYALAGPGAGETLIDAVAETRSLFVDTAQQDDLEHLLKLVYRDPDADLYRTRWQLRGFPRLVRVDAAFPRLTPALLDGLGPMRERIVDVRYQVRLEGMGIESGTPAFEAIVRA